MNVRIVIIIALGVLPAATAYAQREFGRGRRMFDGDPNEFYVPPDWKQNVPYDGRFTFARIKYRGFSHWSGREGPGWSHDYPRAEEHFMRIINEITTMRPFVASELALGGNIIALDDPDLFKYPVAYLSEPGGWFPTEKEVTGLQAYLRKGGFIIFDDFDGGGMNEDYTHFVQVMGRVLPEGRIVDVPETHPIFDSFFTVDLRLMDRGGSFNYGRARYLGIFKDNDPRKRIMAIINLNQDIGEYWQWSGSGFAIAPSNEAYKLGVNYLIYALTH
jgi:Domain of unknown function (DUF4159)